MACILQTAGFIQGGSDFRFEEYDGESWDDVGNSTDLPNYPFMFVLPSGNVMYAGAEGAGGDDASLFVRQPSGEWARTATGTSPIPGGSAVMYEPGKVMKSGGGSRGDCGVVEGNPRATTVTMDTTVSNMGFTEDGNGPMHRRRHFHGLTLLPDGTVLATAGNSCGNGEVTDDSSNPCFARHNGAEYEPCDEGDDDCLEVIEIPCELASECPSWATCGSDSSPDCPGETCTCNPANNACYATREAELWNPATGQWCLMAEQEHERMYHSTSMLLPDGRVLSSGNGRRQQLVTRKTAEFFSPPYLLQGNERPEVTAINDVSPGSAIVPELPYDEPVRITLAEGGPGFDEIGRVTLVKLVKLGSVTHQNDMGQRFLDLDCFWDTSPPGSDGVDETGGGPPSREITVNGPANRNIATPGHYMLFVLTESGTPSVGRYVHVGE